MADNEFGYTAWGMDWVRLAEPLRQTRPEPLLPRARSIARNGGVQLTFEGRIARAAIHRGGQASVTHLEVAPLPRSAITAIAELLPDTSVLTDAMHRTLRDAGISLAPVLASTDCSCSARTARCLHMLSVCYAMARAVDENPRLALDIQGCFDPAEQDSDPLEPLRWVPVNTLDPAGYFEQPVR